MKHMARTGVSNWPLPDGSKGMEDPRAIASRKTPFKHLAEYRPVKFLSWSHKRPEMISIHWLPINETLLGKHSWDESDILTFLIDQEQHGLDDGTNPPVPIIPFDQCDFSFRQAV